MKRLAWFQFRDHTKRRPWRVWFVDAMPAEDAANVGMCLYETREIRVLVTQELDKIHDTIAHEMLHAACAHDSHSEENNEADILRAAEERIANVVEPSLLAIFASLGGHLPPLPDRFDAFRNAALARARKAR